MTNVLLFSQLGRSLLCQDMLAQLWYLPQFLVGALVGRWKSLTIIHQKPLFLLPIGFDGPFLMICRVSVHYWVHFLGQPMGLQCQCTWCVTIQWNKLFLMVLFLLSVPSPQLLGILFCLFAFQVFISWFLQWKCWFTSSDTCWQPESSADICWLHDFLLCSW
jgi:hypothetical protein